MRTLTSMMAAAAVMASAGLCRADASTVAGERVEKSAGPVDGTVRSATRGPGGSEDGCSPGPQGPDSDGLTDRAV